MQSDRVRIYDSTNIDTLPWPEKKEGIDPKSYLVPLVKEGVHTFIDNVKTDLKILLVDDIVMPLTINKEEYENGFVCSPYAQYAGFAMEKAQHIQSKALKKAATSLVLLLQKSLKLGQINKVVLVNNWLLTTSLYPPLKDDQVHEVTRFLKNHYPDHAIFFRTVDPLASPMLCEQLKKQNYKLIPSRPVYFIHGAEKKYYTSRCYKKDQKLYEKQEYARGGTETVQMEDIPRITALYRELYIKKHSSLNLQFNEKYFTHLVQNKPISLNVLRGQAGIDAVQGYYWREGVLTCPIFGYDLDKPEETGLYRLLSFHMMEKAKENGMLLNQSSGASSFKTLRRADLVIEYNAIYTSHLSKKRRLFWRFFHAILTYIGAPLMKKLKL